MAKKTTNELFTSLLYVIVGVLLIVFPQEAMSWAMTIAGIFFVISGILDLIRRNWLGGIVSLVIGIVILTLGWTVTTIVLLVLGILIAIRGIVSLIYALGKKKKNLLEIIFAILSVVIGLVLAFGNGLEILIIIVGVLLVVDGAIGLLSALVRRR